MFYLLSSEPHTALSHKHHRLDTTIEHPLTKLLGDESGKVPVGLHQLHAPRLPNERERQRQRQQRQRQQQRHTSVQRRCAWTGRRKGKGREGKGRKEPSSTLDTLLV